jgi:hypothetical protein
MIITVRVQNSCKVPKARYQKGLTHGMFHARITTPMVIVSFFKKRKNGGKYGNNR